MSSKLILENAPSPAIKASKKEDKSIELLRHNFAKQLRLCIKREYAGKIPSYSLIARDYALRSSGYNAVSAETIRKWMQGISVPQSTRLRTLIQWLGGELAEVLQLVAESSKKNNYCVEPLLSETEASRVSFKKEYSVDDYLEMRILNLLKKLTRRDRNMVLSMLESLKHSRDDSHE